MRAAKTDNLNNAERDLHRLFRDEGLCLPISATIAQVETQTLHYLSLQTWFPYLMSRQPALLLGGFQRKGSNAELLLSTFWKNFQSYAPDHAVFDLHGGGDRLSTCVPFFLHLDEGTGLRKSAVLVVSMQPVFGRETSLRFSSLHKVRDMHDRMTQAQSHNNMGNTYLSRFLLTAMPKKMYMGSNVGTYWGMLDLIAKECKALMTDGISIHGVKYYPICIGVKGDQPALIKCGNFKRSFMNMAKNKGCCWECLAGFDEFPFEDTTPTPAWLSTIGLVDPWPAASPSPLLQVPGYSDNLTLFWRRDPFHAFKQTIGGHFAASLIILFAVDFGLWKVPGLSSSVDEVLARAFYDFSFWVQFEWRGSVRNHIKAFTRQILHFPDHSKFPFARFKGSDQMILLRWLRHLILNGVVFESDITRASANLINSPPADGQKEFFWNALHGCEGGIQFFHSLHREGLWLKEVSNVMASNCRLFCTSYRRLAMLCHLKGLARFHMEPSLHTFCHFAVDLSVSSPIKLSPASSTTEADEDFVGKVARLCRHVSAMQTTKRCIERYLIRLYFEFEKAWVTSISYLNYSEKNKS